MIQQSNYPWDGDIHLTVKSKSAIDFNLLLRIPGWARNEAIPGDLYQFQKAGASQGIIKINGQQVKYEIVKGYAVINRKWRGDDVVEIALPMEVKKVIANTNVKDDIGKLALQRGPIIYCAEWKDNNGRTSNLVLPEQAVITSTYQPALLNGVITLETELRAVQVDTTGLNVSTQKQRLVAIPYYAWANRGKGEMNIWFPAIVKDIDLISK